MILGFANPNRHWHRWTPMNNDVTTVKHCACGATRQWVATKWVVRKPKAKKPKVNYSDATVSPGFGSHA